VVSHSAKLANLCDVEALRVEIAAARHASLPIEVRVHPCCGDNDPTTFLMEDCGIVRRTHVGVEPDSQRTLGADELPNRLCRADDWRGERESLDWNDQTLLATGTGRRALTHHDRTMLGPLQDRFHLLS
jgi:hypothetical protein